jgi:neutral/alkaline ceramidase-like enzyme
MTRAGASKIEISTAAVGARLMGYANRAEAALSVHDPLFARALVLESGERRLAICSLDLCAVCEDVVAAARARIAARTAIAAQDVFIAATHTHSGPHDDDAGCWPDGLQTPIADAVEQAVARLAPARIGAGWGLLLGHAVNRRRLEDPVDPAVCVLRVDDPDGVPLAVLYGFGCHPVVLGPDNHHVSGDWPASAADALESQLGPDVVALFAQGACADVNPLTDGVRDRFASGAIVRAHVEGIGYYGSARDGLPEFDVTDRTGGTFAEARSLGTAVAQEVMRVRGGIATGEVTGLWTRQVAIAQPGDVDPAAGPLGSHGIPRAATHEPIQVMLVGIDGPDVVLVGQPGEVFAQTGAGLRRDLRAAGVRHPFVVGYANGWRAYLPPREAYADGGYEIDWARAVGLAPSLQDDIRSAVLACAKGKEPSCR